MSWHYLAGQVEESSVACCVDGEPLPPLKSKTTHAEFYCKGKLTESYLDSLSGTMFAHSTDDRGEEKLTLSAADSLAKTSAQQEKVQESQANGLDSGKSMLASLAKYDPDSHSWKTAQCLLLGGLEPYSGTWPRWGMMRDGVCWELAMPAHLTSETEFGYLLPTPTCADAGAGAILNENTKLITLKSDRLQKISNQGVSGSIGLARTIAMWPTPRAGNPGSRPNGKGGKILAEEVKKTQMWPTPCTRDYKGANAPEGLTRKDGKSRIDQPPNAVAHGGTSTRQTYPTPRCFMHKDALTDRGKSNLGEVINQQEGMTITGQLSPDWVEWLMGWPIGWTDLKPLAMDRFRLWLRLHGVR
jgi:hypothetical protein